MSRARRQHTAPVAALLDASEAEVCKGSRTHMLALITQIDAELVGSIATSPELWKLASSLQAEADRRLSPSSA
jgi:hypothetical protein